MTDLLRVVIVDDEVLARESLKTALEGMAEIAIVGECGNGFEAVQAVQQLKPHLLFLDIQMPKLDGFDVVELLGQEAPFVIFVTSYDEYALRAFEAAALDYLLKPAKPERLQKAICRAREQLLLKNPQGMESLIEKHHDTMAPLNRILVRNGVEVVIIPMPDIVYIEAQDDYVKIYTKDGKGFLKTERMNRLEEMLDPRNFCRIHRSYIINIDCLKKIEPYSKDNRLAIMENGQRLAISRVGYTRLVELL